MILSRKLFRFTFLLFMAVSVFTSCSKDDDLGKEVNTTNTTTTSGSNEDNNTTTVNAAQRVMTTDDDSLCFAFIYPVTVLFPDGTTMAVVNNEQALFDLFDEWEANNPDSDDYPSFQFPLDVTFEGNNRTVNSEDELDELIDYCFEEWEDDDDEEVEEFCFDFVYPLTLVFPGGTTQTVNDFEELFEALDSWYEANEDSDEDVTVVFPVEITLDGDTIAINNEEELEDAFELCEYSFDECFTINYPITIRVDSTDVVVNNTRELATLIEEWYENNPDSDDDPEIVFPITVTMDGGEVVTINNEDELDEIFEACYEDECRGTNLVLGGPKNALEQVASGMHFSAN